jgi:hypothetical protein
MAPIEQKLLELCEEKSPKLVGSKVLKNTPVIFRIKSFVFQPTSFRVFTKAILGPQEPDLYSESGFRNNCA